MALHIGSYAHDEDLITATEEDGKPRVRVYPYAQTAVVLGRGSKAEVELDCAACISDGVPVLRRRGGGCAVVLDSGNVVLSLVLSVPGFGDNLRHFRSISNWLIRAFARLGLPHLKQDGISDLVHGVHKVGGSCIYRRRGLLFYTVSLLAQADIALISRYLCHPPREPDYRRGREHSAFVANIGHPAKSLAAKLTQVLDPNCTTLPGAPSS